MKPVEIRNIVPADRHAVVDITWRTGLFGEDLTGWGIVPDRLIFSYLYSWYYITYEAELSFAAIVDGEVAGYIIGTADTVRQRARFCDLILPKIWRRLTWIRENGLLYDDQYARWVREDLHREISGLWEALPPEVSSYPAHLHINILPEFQRLGIGGRLMERFLGELQERAVPGVHLGTTSFNTKAVPFYLSHGFTLMGKFPIDASRYGLGKGEGLIFAASLT